MRTDKTRIHRLSNTDPTQKLITGRAAVPELPNNSQCAACMRPGEEKTRNERTKHLTCMYLFGFVCGARACPKEQAGTGGKMRFHIYPACIWLAHFGVQGKGKQKKKRKRDRTENLTGLSRNSSEDCVPPCTQLAFWSSLILYLLHRHVLYRSVPVCETLVAHTSLNSYTLIQAQTDLSDFRTSKQDKMKNAQQRLQKVREGGR